MRHSARPGLDVGIPARIPTVRPNRPTKSGLARLPRVSLDRSPLHPSDTSVKPAVLSAVDTVKRFGHFAASVFRHEVGDRGRIEAAPRHAETLAKRFRGLEHVIRDRDGNFHTLVLPWYKQRGNYLWTSSKLV